MPVSTLLLVRSIFSLVSIFLVAADLNFEVLGGGCWSLS